MGLLRRAAGTDIIRREHYMRADLCSGLLYPSLMEFAADP
jgi:hypothetical protein